LVSTRIDLIRWISSGETFNAIFFYYNYQNKLINEKRIMRENVNRCQIERPAQFFFSFSWCRRRQLQR
jgi:hypothetical protein